MNTTNQPDSLINKIRNLLKMADPANGASQNEMEVAMQKAEELMVRHGIEAMQVGEASTSAGPAIQQETINTGRKKRDEDRWIPSVIKKVFEVDVVYTSIWDRTVGEFGGYRHAYMFVGEPNDIAMAKLILPLVYDAMRLGLNRHLRDRGIKWNTHTANSFFRGVAEGFIQSSVHGQQAAMRQFKKEEQDRFALVLVDKKKAIARYVEETIKPTFKKSRSRAGHDAAAAAEGYRRGAAIDATTKLASL
jgi:hypothetical protein